MVSDAREHFTEFYIVKLDPREDTRGDTYLVGEPMLFTMTVINREGVDSSYRVVVTGEENETQVFDFQLESGEKWSEAAVIIHHQVHQNAKVSFHLYKQGIARPYRSLYIWATIASPE